MRPTDGIATAEREDDGLHGEDGGEEVSGARIGLFQIDDLGAGATGEVGDEFEIDDQGAQGHEKTDSPVDEGETDRVCAFEDSGRCSYQPSTFS